MSLDEERNPLLINTIVNSREKRRWFILFSFFTLSFTNGMMWITFAPCLHIFESYYFGRSSLTTVNAINSLSSIYMVVYPLATPVSFDYFKDKGLVGSGLKRGVKIGAALNFIGSSFRYLGAYPSTTGFLLLFIGQTFASLGQAFIVAIPSQLAVTWFPENEINIATSIGVTSNVVGIAFGCVLSPWIVKQASKHSDIPNLLLFQFVLCLVVFNAVWFYFQQLPQQSQKCNINELNDVKSPKRLWKNKNLIYMMIGYGVIMGTQSSFVTFLPQILIPPFGGFMDEKSVGILGAVILLVGFPSSLCIGYCLDCNPRYKLVSSLLFLMTCFSFLGLLISCEQKHFVGVLISCICFGISSYSIAPVLFRYAAVLLFPINEIIPATYLLIAGNIGGALFVVLIGWNESPDLRFPMRIPMITVTFVLAISTLLMLRVKGEVSHFH